MCARACVCFGLTWYSTGTVSFPLTRPRSSARTEFGGIWMLVSDETNSLSTEQLRWKILPHWLHNQYSSSQHKSVMHSSSDGIVLCLSLYYKHQKCVLPFAAQMPAHKNEACVCVCVGGRGRGWEGCVPFHRQVCADSHEPGGRWSWGFIDFNRFTLLSNNSAARGEEGPWRQ